MGARHSFPYIALHRPGFRVLESTMKVEGTEDSLASFTFEKKKLSSKNDVLPGIFMDTNLVYTVDVKYEADIFVKDLVFLSLNSTCMSINTLTDILLSSGTPGNYTRPSDTYFHSKGISTSHVHVGDIQKGRGSVRIVPTRKMYQLQGTSISHVVCAYDAADVLHFFFSCSVFSKNAQSTTLSGNKAKPPKKLRRSTHTIPPKNMKSWKRIYYMYLVILFQFAILGALLATYSSKQLEISRLVSIQTQSEDHPEKIISKSLHSNINRNPEGISSSEIVSEGEDLGIGAGRDENSCNGVDVDSWTDVIGTSSMEKHINEKKNAFQNEINQYSHVKHTEGNGEHILQSYSDAQREIRADSNGDAVNELRIQREEL
eukprot:CFRG4172T1